ncbi:MAG: S8/S53 family peptidase [Myxococcota bacterium]
MQPEDHCPVYTDWEATSLFEAGSPWLAVNGTPVNDTEGHWCRYRWIGPTSEPTAGDLDDLSVQPLVRSMGPDCEVVNPQRDSATDAIIGPALRDVFRDQVGRVEAHQLNDSSGEPTESLRTPVAVAVIDTMPRSEPNDPRTEHGEAMARIITDIACPVPPGGSQGGSCRDRVHRVLGLPRIPTGIDAQRGGYVGSQGDLAAAVIESVREWEQTYDGMEPKPPLIINLSVGWEAAEFGGDGPGMPAAAAAVRRALQYASCHGALIIAAAGNEGLMCHETPLAPATWEQLNAPGVSRCSEFSVNIDPPGAGYRPLVHAVGGLAHDDSLMPGSRLDAQPRLMATATHAVAGENVMTAGLTGTSVAAAVASGTAALVWSYNPSLTPDEVMQVVYEGGIALGSDADFGLGGAAIAPTRKINACGALKLACEQHANCDLALECLPPSPVDLKDAIELVDLAPSTSTTVAFDQVDTCQTVCGEDVDVVSAMGSDACVTTTPLDDIAYVAPQPSSPGCNNCTLQGDKVQASLDDTHDGRVVDRVVVILSDQGEETQFDFGAVPLDHDSITGLQLDSQRMPTSFDSARISISFDGFYRPIEDELVWR